MRGTHRMLTAGLGALLVALAAAAGAGELQLRAVPKAVMDAVTGRFKNAKFVSAAKEQTPEGTVVYEVSLSERGKNIDVTLSAEAEIVLIEKEIDLKRLPKPVADTLNVRYPKAKYRLVEQVYDVKDGKETLIYYETLLVDTKKHPWAIELALDGVVRKVEDKAGEKD